MKNISTEELLKELESRKGVKVYDCSTYKSFGAEIKRKYSQDRGPVILPDAFMLVVVNTSPRS